MKSHSFLVITAFSFATISLLGCVEDKTNPPMSSSLPSANTETIASVAASPSSSPNTNTKTDASVAQPPSPKTGSSSQPSVLQSGTFVDGEHPTKGTVRIVMQNGKRRLELDETFATSTSGPDLVVILHRSADVIGSTFPPAFPIKEGDYVFLADLTSYSGAQSYEIPHSLDLDDFKSVAIWCRRFNATFGAAMLKS